MKWGWSGALLISFALAGLFWFFPPDGDDAYHHTIGAVEQARAWDEGAVYPRYHRGWNGGTGTFAPTIYSPIPLSVQGGFSRLVGDGRRAVGLSLAVALFMVAAVMLAVHRTPIVALIVLAPYVLAIALSRSTTTEAWALVGAAVVLSLAMPGGQLTRPRGLGLAAAVLWVAGCQVGMLLQLGWLLGAAWTAYLVGEWRGIGDGVASAVRSLVQTTSWALAGLITAAVLWLPAIVDGSHLALPELVSGPLDWRRNFLPDSSELGLLLTATAASLVGVTLIVLTRGTSANRAALATAILVGVVLSTPISAPLWHLPRMEVLQFPWRFLGPSTVVTVIAVKSLRGRWRVSSVLFLLLPLALLPVRVASVTDSVPVDSTPEELAILAHQQWGLAPILPSATGFYSSGFHRLESLERLERQAARVAPVARDAGGGSWQVVMSSAGTALLPIQWWPEWKVATDGRELAYSNGWGLVAVELEAGIHEVEASLERSRSRTVGALLSIVGVAALLARCVLSGRDRRTAPSAGAEG